MRGRHSIGHGFDLLVMNIQGNLYIGSYIGTEGWIAVRKLVSSTQVKHLVSCLLQKFLGGGQKGGSEGHLQLPD